MFLVGFVFLACTAEKKSNYKAITEDQQETKSYFVGSESCKQCHDQTHNLWKGSHHDQAMKIADATTILADFDNTTFVHHGTKSSFFKKDGAFYVNTKGEDGLYKDYKIVYTFGFTPLQQYIVEFPNGKYQCLLTAWDSVENKWFHLQPDLDIKHEEWINWSGGSQNWNTMCADCHSTNVHKNYTSETASYNTTYSEINVGCEACHGPASEHNKFYENKEEGTPPQMYVGNLLPGNEIVDKCARCHSRRGQITPYFDYTGKFLDHYAPQLLTEPIYELDGQIRDEDYVYGSFVQSKMYGLGVSCRDCHDVHSMKLKKNGNDLCLMCHAPDYNTEKHHFHKINTEASQCINCHMTGKIYMGNDFRRDHSFRIPRPDQSAKYNTPNACTGCHKDKTDQWASDAVIKNYGGQRQDHFSDHLLTGYFEDYHGFETVFSNTSYPEIARATALNQYANQPLNQKEINALLVYLKDSSAMVRNEAVQVYEKRKGSQFSKNIEPLLQDSIRLVRISAVRYFNSIGADLFSLPNIKQANQEFFDQLELNLDFPAGNHQKAVYYQGKGNIEAAIEAYLEAIRIDDHYNRARMNLALLYYEQGKRVESEKLYLKVIEQEPAFSYAYYMLGLLYSEMGDVEKSMHYLKLATEKQPVNINAFYNYMVLLQQNNLFKESIEVAQKALALSADNERILYVKMLGEMNMKNYESALETAYLLVQINPENKDYQQAFINLQGTLK